MKCYKVVRKLPVCYLSNKFKLLSVVVYSEPEFCREYGTNKLVDMGMVFTEERDARYFNSNLHSSHSQVWEAECSYMEPIDTLADCESPAMRKFWNNEYLDVSYLAPAPKGTHIAFDIRLVRRIDNEKR